MDTIQEYHLLECFAVEQALQSMRTIRPDQGALRAFQPESFPNENLIEFRQARSVRL